MAAVANFDSQGVNQALRRLQEGDRSVAQTVFAALWPIVSSFCRGALGDASQDAAQETLMKVFQQAHQFRPRGDAVAWALEIATWECRTELRRRARELAAPLSNADGVQTGADVASELERKQLAAAVRASIAHLAPGDQSLVISVLDETFPPGSGGTTVKPSVSKSNRRLGSKASMVSPSRQTKRIQRPSCLGREAKLRFSSTLSGWSQSLTKQTLFMSA